MSTEYTGQERTITARAGGEFVIALEEHPTGHEWEADFDHSLFDLVECRFTALGPGLGSGGTRRFRFTAIAPGEAEIRMTYKRRWEAAAAQELIFQVRITN